MNMLTSVSIQTTHQHPHRQKLEANHLHWLKEKHNPNSLDQLYRSHNLVRQNNRVLCFICNKNITSYPENERNIHIANLCLDRSGKSSTTSVSSASSKQDNSQSVLTHISHCPVCKIDWDEIFLAARKQCNYTQHAKLCASIQGISAKKVNEMISSLKIPQNPSQSQSLVVSQTILATKLTNNTPQLLSTTNSSSSSSSSSGSIDSVEPFAMFKGLGSKPNSNTTLTPSNKKRNLMRSKSTNCHSNLDQQPNITFSGKYKNTNSGLSSSLFVKEEYKAKPKISVIDTKDNDDFKGQLSFPAARKPPLPSSFSNRRLPSKKVQEVLDEFDDDFQLAKAMSSSLSNSKNYPSLYSNLTIGQSKLSTRNRRKHNSETSSSIEDGVGVISSNNETGDLLAPFDAIDYLIQRFHCLAEQDRSREEEAQQQRSVDSGNVSRQKRKHSYTNVHILESGNSNFCDSLWSIASCTTQNESSYKTLLLKDI